jgi:hypothetical protein
MNLLAIWSPDAMGQQGSYNASPLIRPMRDKVLQLHFYKMV